MSRGRSWIAIIALLIMATAVVAAATPSGAEAATLRSRLRGARRELRHARHRVDRDKALLATALAAATATTTGTGGVATPTPAATPTPTATTSPALTVDQLRARLASAKRAVRIWSRRVHRMARRYHRRLQMARWERHAKWLPIIRVAAAKYHVNAGGIYRMMMRESGGRRYAGSSTAYKGLFQYWTGTWGSSWNPWRHDSIYDGSSQIFATCYAVHKGWGPKMWTTTYASQY